MSFFYSKAGSLIQIFNLDFESLTFEFHYVCMLANLLNENKTKSYNDWLKKKKLHKESHKKKWQTFQSKSKLPQKKTKLKALKKEKVQIKFFLFVTRQYKLPTYKRTVKWTVKTNSLALTQKHRRSSIQNLCLQLDTADEKSDSEQKFSECEEQQYSLMVLQPRALCSLAQTYIFHFFRIRHGVDRMSGNGRKRGRVKNEGGGSEQTRTQPSHVWHADDSSHMVPH